MPVSPQSSRVDSALTQFALGYRNDKFVADRLSQPVPFDDVAGKYLTRTRREVSHAVNDLISARGRHNEVTWDETWTGFVLLDRGLKCVISEQHRKAAAANGLLSPEQVGIARTMQQMMLNREIRIGSSLTTSGNFTNTGAAGTVWTNKTSSTPVDDIKTAVAAIPSVGADTKLVGYCALPVWNALTSHPSILALKGVSEGLVSESEFARYLGLDEFHVSTVRKETANLGQTASYGYCFTATTFGVIAVPRATPSSLDAEGFCFTIRQTPGVEVRSWEEPGEGKGGSTAHAVELSEIDIIPQADQGYLITSVAS